MRPSLVAVALIALATTTRVGEANMSQPVFVQAARSGGVLTTASADRVRVERIDLSLDFRREGRARSRARYELSTPEDIELPLTFVAAARVTSITLDGVPVPLGGARAGGTYRLTTPKGASHELGDAETSEQDFLIRLVAGKKTVVEITFDAEPGGTTERLAKDMDGLTRLLYDDGYRPRSVRFEYPLWPAVGFGGGVGPIAVTLRTSDGARIVAPGVDLPATSDAAELHAEIAAAAPGVGLDHELTVRTIEVSYLVSYLKRPRLGATLFPTVRLSTGDEGSGHFQLRGSADLYAPDLGALTLGAEADFRGTLAGILAVQRGSASGYGSAYWALGTVVFAKPGTAAGVEGAFGFRALVIPFDAALQVVPFRSAQAAGVGQIRALFGVRVGFLGCPSRTGAAPPRNYGRAAVS